MLKKTLTALAVLGAFSAAATAADVTLYGKIDVGLKYTNVDKTGFDGINHQQDTLELKGGAGQANRIGLTATV